MDRLNDPTCPIGACKNTVKLHIGESIVTLTFTGKSTENTRTKRNKKIRHLIATF